jgi:hypothetical protein
MIKPQTNIKTVQIRLKTKLQEIEAEHICDLLHDNWAEAEGLPYPKAYPGVKKDILYLPLIKRVLEDLVSRCDDGYSIADDNLGLLNTSFAANNDKFGQRTLEAERQYYREVKKVYRALKSAIIAAAKRR